MTDAQDVITSQLASRSVADADDIAWATVWLQACDYQGVTLLAEALAGEPADIPLTRDAIGLDLGGHSAALLAPRIMRDVASHGRVFLRNLRHGLFLLPFSVRANIGIGCPVDPAFALGGERHKNPYAEKLAHAEANGLDIDDPVWAALVPAAS